MYGVFQVAPLNGFCVLGGGGQSSVTPKQFISFLRMGEGEAVEGEEVEGEGD